MFDSKFANKIWKKLYTVRIPDRLTLSDSYIRNRGVTTSRDKMYADMMDDNYTTVKIPVIKMLEYYIDGLDLLIPSREDMITIHKDIEGYMMEWRRYMESSINNQSSKYASMLLDLEKLSKYIYNKASPKEVSVFKSDDMPKFGMKIDLKPIHKKEPEPIIKNEYEGISKLLKNRQHNRYR